MSSFGLHVPRGQTIHEISYPLPEEMKEMGYATYERIVFPTPLNVGPDDTLEYIYDTEGFIQEIRLNGKPVEFKAEAIL